MAKHGFDVAPLDPGDPRGVSRMVERYTLCRSEAAAPPVRSLFDVHQDGANFGSTGCNTVLVYLNSTCEGGALRIYTHEHDPAPRHVETSAPAGKKCVILMSGEVWHDVEPVRGVGVRDVFVFQGELPS